MSPKARDLIARFLQKLMLTYRLVWGPDAAHKNCWRTVNKDSGDPAAQENINHRAILASSAEFKTVSAGSLKKKKPFGRAVNLFQTAFTIESC